LRATLKWRHVMELVIRCKEKHVARLPMNDRRIAVRFLRDRVIAREVDWGYSAGLLESPGVVANERRIPFCDTGRQRIGVVQQTGASGLAEALTDAPKVAEQQPMQIEQRGMREAR